MFYSPIQPALLVSVRSAAEALQALAGGADIIDVKEPGRGPLGAADADTIQQVIAAVAGRCPVTAAAGELLEADTDWLPPNIAGLSLLKFGLAGCRKQPDWRQRLAERQQRAGNIEVIPVAYADARAADAPEAIDALAATAALAARWIMVDTFDKSGPGLLECFDRRQLAGLIDAVHASGRNVAIAGRLDFDDAAQAARLGANLIGVRGAVCPDGRDAHVTRQLVAALRDHLRGAARASRSPCPCANVTPPENI